MSRAVPLRHTSRRVMKIRPYKIAIDEREILDLRRRLEQTRWPSQVQDAGWAMGMDGAFLKGLVRYWSQEFDWRAIESRLNRVPQFEAVTDAGSIHFPHLRGGGAPALPIGGTRRQIRYRDTVL
jgi:epoxide hydrolase